MIEAYCSPMMYPRPRTAAEVFMVNTALYRSVKPLSAPMAPVEKFSVHARMDGPMKSNRAAATAE